MGESSESLHLWQRTHAQARELLRRAKVPGRIVATNARWTTIVPVEAEQIRHCLTALPGLILHWKFFGDFGLGLGFWENGKELGQADFTWVPSVEESSSPRLVERLRAAGIVHSFEPLFGVASEVHGGTCLPRTVRDRAAALLGIPAYEWLSPDDVLDSPLEDMRQMYPEAVDIASDEI